MFESLREAVIGLIINLIGTSCLLHHGRVITRVLCSCIDAAQRIETFLARVYLSFSMLLGPPCYI